MAYINQNSDLIESDMVTCFDGTVCHIDDTVYVESINHFAQYEQVITGENGYELLPELMSILRNGKNFAACEKSIKILNEKLVNFTENGMQCLFLEAYSKRDEAIKKLAQIIEQSVKKEKCNMKVSNMYSNNGNKVPNQFVIENGTKTVFQSYNTIVAVKENDKVILDSKALEYSATTLKYLKHFLGTTESKKSLHEKIESGFYQVEDLNN